MKKKIMSILVVLSVILAACTAPSKKIQLYSQSTREDVFREVNGEEPRPGFVNVEIKASIKTRLEESITRAGKYVFPFLFNIDGQAVQWNVEGRRESAPFTAASGGEENPEGGEGIKYILAKKITLKAGKHEVFFGAPEKDYYKQFELDIDEGKSYTVELKPIYTWKHRYHVRSFEKGLAYYEVSVN